MKSNLFPIAKEGFVFLYISIALFALFFFFGFEYLSFAALSMTIFFIYAFRNPERAISIYEEGSIVSPVDGIVTAIKEIPDGSQFVEIDSSLSDVALLRAPFSSKVTASQVCYGAKLPLEHPLAKHLNEHSQVTFTDKALNWVTVKQILKQSFTSINIDVKKDTELFQGVRYGFAYNSLTTITLPKNFKLRIGVGTVLTASETLIGVFE